MGSICDITFAHSLTDVKVKLGMFSFTSFTHRSYSNTSKVCAVSVCRTVCHVQVQLWDRCKDEKTVRGRLGCACSVTVLTGLWYSSKELELENLLTFLTGLCVCGCARVIGRACQFVSQSGLHETACLLGFLCSGVQQSWGSIGADDSLAKPLSYGGTWQLQQHRGDFGTFSLGATLCHVFVIRPSLLNPYW